MAQAGAEEHRVSAGLALDTTLAETGRSSNGTGGGSGHN